MDKSFAESVAESGPHAFPFVIKREGVCETGMTLRQWYAGQAMTLIGIPVNCNRPEDWTRTTEYADTLAEIAFIIADAMIRRGKA